MYSGLTLVLTHLYLLFGILKLKVLHKTGKLETEKMNVLSSEILETGTPKYEKLGKIVTRKKTFYMYSIYIYIYR